MNDIERWIYFDGPEPAHLRPLLDALRAQRGLPPAPLPPPPPPPEVKERAIRRVMERLNALYPPGQAPAGVEEGEGEGAGTAGAPNASIAAPDVARRGNKDDVTARSLTFEDREDVLPPGARHVPKAR